MSWFNRTPHPRKVGKSRPKVPKPIYQKLQETQDEKEVEAVPKKSKNIGGSNVKG